MNRIDIMKAALSGESKDIARLMLSEVQIKTLVALGTGYMSVSALADKTGEPQNRLYIRLCKLFDAGYISRRKIEGGTKKGAIYLYSLSDVTIKELIK